jgi:hypothetical protein
MSTPDLCSEIISVHSVSYIAKMPNVNVKKEGNRKFRVVQQENEQVHVHVTIKQVTNLNCTYLNVYFQWYSCVACATAVALLCEAVPHNIPYIFNAVPCCAHHRFSRLSQSQTHRGDSIILLPQQLGASRHNGTLRSSGIESGKYCLPLVTDIPFSVKTNVDRWQQQ